MRSLLDAVAAQIRRPRTRGARAALLQVAGFGLVSVALGMWLVPVGVGAAGLSLLVMSGLLE